MYEEMLPSIYFYSFILGGGFLLFQFLLSLLGWGFDTDLESDWEVDEMDLGSDSEIPSSHSLFSFFQYLSLRFITTFFAFFGVVGLCVSRWNLPWLLGLFLALSIGWLAGIGVGWGMRWLVRFNAVGNTDFTRAAGKTATVYVSIPPHRSQMGKVQLTLQGHTEEMEALTDGNALPTGTLVRIQAVLDGRIAVVEPLSGEVP